MPKEASSRPAGCHYIPQRSIERVAAELRSLPAMPAADCTSRLVTAATAHTLGAPLQDDVTALVVRIL
ncbi:MAG: hypothetical protein HUU02_03315 [Bacteroidetes bacterium]|nr:hypothetical protein [Bacteroidota bacterium]